MRLVGLKLVYTREIGIPFAAAAMGEIIAAARKPALMSEPTFSRFLGEGYRFFCGAVNRLFSRTSVRENNL